MTTTVATLFALTAFAVNSILCRLALDEASIDPVSFSTVRLFSGAFTLLGLAYDDHSLCGLSYAWEGGFCQEKRRGLEKNDRQTQSPERADFR